MWCVGILSIIERINCIGHGKTGSRSLSCHSPYCCAVEESCFEFVHELEILDHINFPFLGWGGGGVGTGEEECPMYWI